MVKSSLQVIIPVGIGAVLGIVILSNVLKILLHRFHRATVGVLLGVLLGSVIGLWPFTQSVGAKALEARTFEEVKSYAEKWQLPGLESLGNREALVEHIMDRTIWDQRRTPAISGREAGLALLMVLLGFGMTFALSRTGGVGNE